MQIDRQIIVIERMRKYESQKEMEKRIRGRRGGDGGEKGREREMHTRETEKAIHSVHVKRILLSLSHHSPLVVSG